MNATRSRDEAIAWYLQTGECDGYYSAWGGNDLMDRERRAIADLKGALINEVRKPSATAKMPDEIRHLDMGTFTRSKVTPMVSGLFPKQEREAVLRMFDTSIIFLTPGNIEKTIAEGRWLHTLWDLTNLYLGSIGAQPLAAGNGSILGLSEETTCYISVEYFRSKNRFDDFVVHEAAHVFHNCKRRTVGLRETRRREWLLDIAYRKRETFAYACEAHSRLLQLGKTRTERLGFLKELTNASMPADERVDSAEYLDILREAVVARNGWKRILARCTSR